jgi:cytidylate kinase
MPEGPTLTTLLGRRNVGRVARSVICVSGSDGAGGDQVARLVADRLGLRYIAEDIVSDAARRAGVGSERMTDVEQRKSLVRRVLDGLGETGAAGMALGGVPPPAPVEPRPVRSDELQVFIREAIEAAAATGAVVIYAHAASIALAGREDILRVLVTASAETRAKRIVVQGGISEADAQRELRAGDAERADYLQRFYGVRTELPTQYDLVINTDLLSHEDAAGIVAQAAA